VPQTQQQQIAQTTVSPPKQARSRAAWGRVLEAGAGILEADGLDAFTISAVCEQADVSVAAIYSRVQNKDGLFLAVYENALEQMTTERRVLEEDEESYKDVITADLVSFAVVTIADIFLTRRGLIRSIIRLSASHEEVRQHGSEWMTTLGRTFTELLRSREDDYTHDDVPAALTVCYRALWSSVAMYVAYGPNFASEFDTADDQFKDELCDTAIRYLLSEPPAEREPHTQR
jgi:AcrR family transcriptional regulator